MFRSIGRNFVGESSRASRAQRLSISREVNRDIAIYLAGCHRGHPYHAAFRPYPCFIRQASTTTSSAGKTVNKDDSQVPVPSSPGTRKPRVDLKPGPVKSTFTPSSPPHPLASRSGSSSEHTAKQVTEPSVGSNKDTSNMSALQLAKLDITLSIADGTLKAPPENLSSFKRFLHQAIEIFKFYLRGLMAINTHRRQAAAIRARVASGGPAISRAEHRFIRTYQRDALKLVPFVIICLILEEIIPFIALYAPRMLPSTCMFPSQRARIQAQAHVAQLNYLSIYKSAFSTLKQKGLETGYVTPRQLADASSHPAALCGLLGLPTWGPTQLAVWRINRHFRYISNDDNALRKEDSGKHLTRLELNEALHERGIMGDGLSVEDMERRLQWWLVEVNEPKGDIVSRRIMVTATAASNS